MKLAGLLKYLGPMGIIVLTFVVGGFVVFALSGSLLRVGTKVVVVSTSDSFASVNNSAHECPTNGSCTTGISATFGIKVGVTSTVRVRAGTSTVPINRSRRTAFVGLQEHSYTKYFGSAPVSTVSLVNTSTYRVNDTAPGASRWTGTGVNFVNNTANTTDGKSDFSIDAGAGSRSKLVKYSPWLVGLGLLVVAGAGPVALAAFRRHRGRRPVHD